MDLQRDRIGEKSALRSFAGKRHNSTGSKKPYDHRKAPQKQNCVVERPRWRSCFYKPSQKDGRLRKQHSLWVQGDVYCSKQKLAHQRFNRQQQQHRQLPHLPSSDPVTQVKQEAMSHLVSSMDDLSIKTTLCKSYSLDESNCKETSLTQGDNLRVLKGKWTPRSASSSSRLNTSKASHCSIVPSPKLPKITLSLPPSSSKKLIRGSSTVTQIKSPFSLSLFNTRPALIH